MQASGIKKSGHDSSIASGQKHAYFNSNYKTGLYMKERKNTVLGFESSTVGVAVQCTQYCGWV